MKILLLGPGDSIHIRRWAEALSFAGIEIILFTLEKIKDDFYIKKNIKIYDWNLYHQQSELSKIIYLKTIYRLKKVIKLEQPDILHAHYASSYGLLGALSNFHPYIISVWGSDIYDFPNTSFFHRRIIKYNLSKADKILSTSHIMARETALYTNKHISVTPFGVDVNLFRKTENIRNNPFIVGNVKTLSPKYGIDVLIEAYKVIVENNRNRDTKLVIVGDGPHRSEYESLVQTLGLKDKVWFVGKVPNNQLVQYYNSFSVSVSVSVSDSESFGVVAVEAMACECPVVTSDADGFTEVVEDGKTGFIVPKRNVKLTAKAIQRFIDEPALRDRMGENGRKRVLDLYNWRDNVQTMINIYHKTKNL